MAKRAVAVVAAVAMVVAAVIIRARLDDNGHRVAVATSSDTGTPLSIVCVTELRAACDTLATADPSMSVRVEDASTTATALAKGGAHVDGWFTIDPWPDITNAFASQTVMTAETPIASSPLVIAMVKERELVLGPNCPTGTVDWKCLGDNVGRQWTSFTGGVKAWGNVTVGLPPLASATGLLLFANAVSAYFGRVDITADELQKDTQFAAWRDRFDNTFTEVDPLAEFVARFPMAFSAIGTTGAAAHTGAAPVAPQVVVVGPAPAATAIAVLAPTVAGPRADRVAKLASNPEVVAALEQQGWTIGPIPASTGLPPPDVLLALSGLRS